MGENSTGQFGWKYPSMGGRKIQWPKFTIRPGYDKNIIRFGYDKI